MDEVESLHTKHHSMAILIDSCLVIDDCPYLVPSWLHDTNGTLHLSNNVYTCPTMADSGTWYIEELKSIIETIPSFLPPNNTQH